MARFSWIPLYEELATALLAWSNRQAELVAFLEGLRKSGCKVVPLEDRGAGGERFLLRELDPFTFFGSFNRGITLDNRIAILRVVGVNYLDRHASIILAGRGVVHLRSC